MVKQSVDILIIGGGLTGATLMLALQHLGLNVLLVEAAAFSDRLHHDFDARSLALSQASQRILKQLGIWDILDEYATAIRTIHVSEQRRFGKSRLKAAQNNPLGYVVEMQHIELALQKLLTGHPITSPATVTALDMDSKTATITTASGQKTISAQLIVAADGTHSSIRQLCQLPVTLKCYNQQAIVANIGLSKGHEYKAYERFTPYGPLALLPMTGNRMSLVWAMTPEQAEQSMALSDPLFLKELQQAFGYRLGRLIKVGTRYCYPLKQALMPQQTQWPVIFLGNAAHTLHPVAGQGFNLGLRDAAILAQCIEVHGLNRTMLKNYVQLRQHDQRRITQLTDGLIEVFTSRIPGLGLLRTMGLLAFDAIPVLKNTLTRYTQGFGGVIPDLACDIAPKRHPEELS